MATAQEEFDALFSEKSTSLPHPEDRSASSRSPSPSPEPEHFYEHDDLDQLPPQSTRSRDTIPRLHSNRNTGPKGVIADAQAFEQARRQGRYSTPPSRLDGSRARESEELLCSDEEDDGFIEQWRQSRLSELQRGGRGGGQGQKSDHEKGSRRTYGILVEVDGEGYLEAVEESPVGTVVVVFIFDDRSEISEMVEDCVKVLARKYPTTRCIKLDYQEAEMEVAGVPAILAYRGGEKFAGLVPVVDEIPDDAELDATSLEALLKRHQILL